MKISFIGAGKVGTAFGKYLSTYYDVLYYNSRKAESAKKAADYVGCLWENDLNKIIRATDLIVITTSDDQIQSVCETILSLPCDKTEKYFMHMSGALTTEVFGDLKELCKGVASVHPLQTFASIEQAVLDLKKAYFSIESDCDFFKTLIKNMQNPYFVLKKEQKVKYHLAACVFSNYLVTLMNFGSRMLNDIGISESEGIQAMMPLIHATLNNVLMSGTHNALTGPIQRGDTETLKKHTEVLSGDNMMLYKLLGEMTTTHLIEDQNKKTILESFWRSL